VRKPVEQRMREVVDLAGEPMNEQKRRAAALVEIVQPRAVNIDELSARRYFLFDLARGPAGEQNEADQDQEDERNGKACDPIAVANVTAMRL
jgi:hypothetical protein